MTSFDSAMRRTRKALLLAGNEAGRTSHYRQTSGARLTPKGDVTCRGRKFTLGQIAFRASWLPWNGTKPVRVGTDPDTRTLGIIQLAILNRIKAKPERATAREITDDLSKLFGERIPDAQVFVTLSRLRDRGLVEAIHEPSGEGEGHEANPSEVDPRSQIARLQITRTSRGRRAANMKLTPLGVEAVEQAARILLESALPP